MNVMTVTRRDFCSLASTAVAGMALSGCRSLGFRRWYRGSLHTHTYWSDGRGFPEDCVSAYRSLGYDFVAITDHNRIGTDSDCWRDVEPEDGPWPPAVSRPVFEHYVRTYAHARTRKGVNGKSQVRLQPIDETIRQFGEPGRFLIMKGVELTYSTYAKDFTNCTNLHMNCLNVPTVIPDASCDGLIANRPGVLVRDLIAQCHAAYVDSLAKVGNPPSLFMVNHPQSIMLDNTPDDFLANPAVRFFEVCNNGSDFDMPPEIGDDGWSNDRLWDAVNAIRARRGEALLYGTGSDDAHWYPGNGHANKPHTSCTPGNAWVSVRASSLTPEALFAAMDRGDFYASCGVELEDVRFDGESLSVVVPAKPGVTYTVRFIVSKRDFSETPVRTVEMQFPQGNDPKRLIKRKLSFYDSKIGQTAKYVKGRSGNGIAASYALKSDDLYVRARIESSEPAILSARLYPKVRCAWTQPYQHA